MSSLKRMQDVLLKMTLEIVMDKIVERSLALTMTDAEGNREVIADIIREEYNSSPLVLQKPLDDFLIENFTAAVYSLAESGEGEETLAMITEAHKKRDITLS